MFDPYETDENDPNGPWGTGEENDPNGPWGTGE